ncbi:MAG: HIT domain-containing protein [Brevundimonas sp.]|uniref:HIT domain-containing protein n=1 Tax=Brevundimonas sp. TaxID=1871086 RepID=UPI002488C84A|nr:HIT domain-containing protein [Brevundimonas sp.]MDI1327964.1 HIT domain-containing protein [Brevundimonas sp.]
MTAPFKADPAFEAGSAVVCDWPLCEVRLQDDARFPWLILIPRRAGLRELEDLTPADRATLMDEVVRAGELVRMLGGAAGRAVEKLNVGALGNVTAQLHVHVVGRRHDDGLWPDPVWGRGAALPYGASALQAAVSGLRQETRRSPAG